MIQSDVLPQQALDYLNSLSVAANKQAEDKGRIGARAELLQWCVDWFTTSQTWRKQSYEDDWVMWQRNADGRYDPRLKSQKKPWQSTAFVDITPSHRESIHAELFRLIAGSRPIDDVTARPGGDPAQADNIRDLVLREKEKSGFEVEYNKTLEDRTTYGSSFARFWHEERYEDRVVREPVYEAINPMDPGSIVRKMFGQPKQVGFREVIKPQCIYRGVRKQHVSIWDFFWDPKALELKGYPCLIRARLTLQEIMDRVKSGEFMPEAAVVFHQAAPQETIPADKQSVQAERGIADSAPRREGNQKSWESYDMYARLPQKWVYPLLKTPIPVTDAEKLVPARVIFAKAAVFAVELNKKYDGEAPVLKDDYFPVAGRFIGRGIPEMLKNPQVVVNEVVNQRLDEGNLALNEGIAVIEKGLANPEDLLAGGPGMVLRINAKATGPNGDIRNAVFPLGRPDVKINAGFAEVHEWERMAQERTSVNRAEHGMNPLPGGAKTLGGMQLLKQNAGAKFAFIQMLSEFAYIKRVFRIYWELIYQNIQPQEVVDALGPQRAQAFLQAFGNLTPEQVENAYRYEPKGIFEREAKAEKHARLAAIHEQFKGMPGLNDMEFFDEECKSFGMDPERLKFPDAQAKFLMAKAQQMAEPMAKQMLQQIILGMAAKDVERNLAEKVADEVDGAKQEEVSGVTDLAGKKEPKGNI